MFDILRPAPTAADFTHAALWAAVEAVFAADEIVEPFHRLSCRGQETVVVCIAQAIEQGHEGAAAARLGWDRCSQPRSIDPGQTGSDLDNDLFMDRLFMDRVAHRG